MQLDPMEPKLKPPGTERLILKCDVLLSTSAFKLSLRRYNEVLIDDERQGLTLVHFSAQRKRFL